MFGTAAFDSMPESFLTDPAAWDVFVGQVWQAVLAPLDLPPDATVIEIAPGSSAKIGHALAALGFVGTLHVVEASAPALDILLAQYRRLLPAATLHAHACPLSACRALLPQGAQAVLGNHIIDDMLLAAASASGATFDWAVRYSNHVTQDTHSASAELARKPQVIGAVSRELSDTIAALAPRQCVLSQYPSATLQDNGLDTLNAAATRALTEITDCLGTAYRLRDCTQALAALPHYHNAHIGHHVLNPAYWLSCTRIP